MPNVHIALLTIEFHLHGCRSLKEKRGRMRGLADRFGRQVNVAVTESGDQDVLDRACYSFVVAASDVRIVERTLAAVEREIEQVVEAVVCGRNQQWL